MAGEGERAQRLVEQLLADPALRAEFRSDPVGTARRAGLPDFADEMLAAGADPLQTLDRRESRSSLAGVVMAAALEGVGLSEMLQDHGGPPHGGGEGAGRAAARLEDVGGRRRERSVGRLDDIAGRRRERAAPSPEDVAARRAERSGRRL